MSDEFLRVEAPIAELVPPQWREGWVWMTCYRMYCVAQDQLLTGWEIDLLGVSGHLLWGGAPYFEQTHRIRAEPDGSIVVAMNVEGVCHSDDGPFLLLMTPTDRAGDPGDEETISRVRAIVALLRLALGPNVAAEHLGDLSINPSTDEVKAAGPALSMPNWDGPPDVSDAALAFLNDLHLALDRLDGVQRNRVELSLLWFFKAQKNHGVDSFLMYWFTLEALAMPGSAKVSALETALANAYAISLDEARRRFRMGRLYGLRGGIVHRGVQPSVHARLLEFMAAVYWDLLLDKVGLPPRQAAERLLIAHGADPWFPR